MKDVRFWGGGGWGGVGVQGIQGKTLPIAWQSAQPYVLKAELLSLLYKTHPVMGLRAKKHREHQFPWELASLPQSIAHLNIPRNHALA